LDSGFFLGLEDLDFCYRAGQAGWQVVYYAGDEVVHYHGFSSGGTRSVLRFYYDKLGMDRYLAKHFPEKMLTRFVVRQMYNIKINFVRMRDIINKYFQPKFKPKDITMAITWRCNARCRMCNIWQNENPLDLSPQAMDNLSRHARYINVSGGEPFLHPDLPEVIARIKKASPKAKIIISTNGYATDRIIEQARKILAIDKTVGIRVSVDGRPETHDAIRGRTGMYDRAMETIDKLRELGVGNLGISFTIMSGNACELTDIYELSRQKNLQLALALVQNSEIYFCKRDNELTEHECIRSGLKYVINSELASWNLKRWLRSYYDYGLLYYAEFTNRLLPSGAGFDSLFIDADGAIHPSNLINLSIGDLHQGRLDDIWQSDQAQQVRNRIIRELITESWIVCTIRGEIKKHWFQVGKWVAKNKLRTLLKRPLL